MTEFLYLDDGYLRAFDASVMAHSGQSVVLDRTAFFPEVEGNRPIDAQADGGSHVANTREIGRLVITKTDNKGKFNRRLEIALV